MPLPRCYFDISINGIPTGRIVFELFSDICPKTCENFRCLCTGEKGEGKTTYKPLHYKGTLIHRIVKGFIVQGGDFENGDGSGGESIYGGFFKDENFKIKHESPFLLSMANKGMNTNGSQFFITTRSAAHLDGVHVVFGRVVSGMEFVTEMENQKVNSKNRPYADIRVTNCGELVLLKRGKVVKSGKVADSASSSSDESSSDDSESEDSELERRQRRRRKRKEKRKASRRKSKDGKRRSKKRRKSKRSDSSSEGEEGDAPVVTSTINEDDLPPEISSSSSRKPWLYRFSRSPSPLEGEDTNKKKRRKEQFELNTKESQQPVISSSGRILKGRGNMRYRTPPPVTQYSRNVKYQPDRDRYRKSPETDRNQNRSPNRDRYRNRSLDRDRYRQRSPDRDQYRNRSPDRDQYRNRSPDRDQYRNRSPDRDQHRNRSPDRDQYRNRSLERDRYRQRSPDRDRYRLKDRERYQNRSPDRSHRSQGRDEHRNKSPDRDQYRNKSPDRDRYRNRSPDRDWNRNKSLDRDQYQNRSLDRDQYRNRSPDRDRYRNRSSDRGQYQNKSPDRDQYRNRSPDRDQYQNSSLDRDPGRSWDDKSPVSRIEARIKARRYGDRSPLGQRSPPQGQRSPPGQSTLLEDRQQQSITNITEDRETSTPPLSYEDHTPLHDEHTEYWSNEAYRLVQESFNLNKEGNAPASKWESTGGPDNEGQSDEDKDLETAYQKVEQDLAEQQFGINALLDKHLNN